MHRNPLSKDELHTICREIGDEIRSLVVARLDARINEEDFVAGLLRLETERAVHHGLVMTASDSLTGWTTISLRLRGETEPCASFEFHAASGQFRRIDER